MELPEWESPVGGCYTIRTPRKEGLRESGMREQREVGLRTRKNLPKEKTVDLQKGGTKTLPIN